MCGGRLLHSVLPRGWSGTCARVRVAQDVTVIPHVQLQTNAIQHLEGKLVRSRSKRSYVPDSQVTIDAIGQPRGIPNEFKASSEISAGFESIILWIAPAKNAEWINYIYYNQQRFINYMDTALTALGEQLQATSKMTWQNRQALDWILAEKGGVCVMSGEQCCTFIQNNTAPDGSFTQAMIKLKQLRKEVKDNAGSDAHTWDWLEMSLGQWRTTLTKVGIVIGIVLAVLAVVACCVIPLLRAFLTKTVVSQMPLRAMDSAASDLEVIPLQGHPGQYMDKYGNPCNAKGRPLNCPYGNPDCEWSVRAGAGWACIDYYQNSMSAGNVAVVVPVVNGKMCDNPVINCSVINQGYEEMELQA
ncbi:syncytin-2-like isoform X1 [Esox lucius]|uniref:syncytin-2-like isoform X1 n=1 Tax=Esox lucius TaxID=8010 RepID=UPI0014777FC9|nr:syncytin-2-like isoform X1 [Esox lucius]XP_034153090.1 syncytin-2-like isoform X1 [Esox lucius]XP_034153091.1 syncytin-2-like isoform X1 [Esox lucius]